MDVIDQSIAESFSVVITTRALVSLAMMMSVGVSTDTSAASSGLISFSDIARLGTFRLPGGDANYARGVIEVNSANQSFYMVGHKHRNEVAEYGIPDIVSSSTNLNTLATATLLQGYQNVMQRTVGRSMKSLKKSVGSS